MGGKHRGGGICGAIAFGLLVLAVMPFVGAAYAIWG